MKTMYMIFDARAMEDIGDAICLFATPILKEAKSMRKHYGACVIAKTNPNDKNSKIKLMPETYYKGLNDNS